MFSLIKKLVLTSSLILVSTVYTLPSYAQTDTNAIKAIFIQAMEYQDYNNDSALLLAQKGFNLSKKVNYKAGIGMAFMRFGALMNIKGETDSALMYFRSALAIRKSLGNHANTAGLCIQMSNVFKNKGVKDSAFYYMYEAQRYYDKTNDSVQIASVYVELANLYTTYGNYAISLKNLNKALPIFVKNNNSELLSQTYIEYGNLYFKQSENKKALFYYLKAKKVNEVFENPTYSALIDNCIGLCYDEMGDKQNAILYFKKSISAYTELEMPNELAMLHFNLGNLYVNIKQADLGIHHLEIAKKIGEEIKDTYRISRCFEILSDAYAIKGDYYRAYQCYLKYNALSDSILNEEKVKQIAEMNVLYDTEKKSQQIELLDAQNKTKTARNNLLVSGIITLIISLFILAYILIQRNRIAKKNETIAQQKIENILNEQEIKTYNAMLEGQEEERKRIANDLHDRLGSMLSTVKLLFSALDNKIDKAVDDNKQQYNKATSLLDEACVEVRRISHNLSTGMVSNFGLNAALEELSESINESKLISCKLLVYGLEERLDLSIEIGIYRMIQEILNNILKHAQAKNIIIQINKYDDSINITIEDNGVGFNVEEKKNSGGLGLASIEARAKKLSGTYTIDSSIGRGSISIIDIPLI